jgi:hypothetical protein
MFGDDVRGHASSLNARSVARLTIERELLAVRFLACH